MAYGKSCCLLVELEHKAYRAIKKLNFQIDGTREAKKFDLNEPNEIGRDAYHNAQIFNVKTKAFHDKHIVNREFVPC